MPTLTLTHAKQVSACSEAKRLAQSRVPLHLVAGWLDATASPAICAFLNGQQTAGACVRASVGFRIFSDLLVPACRQLVPRGHLPLMVTQPATVLPKAAVSLVFECITGTSAYLKTAFAVAGSELIIGPWGHGGLTNYSPEKQAKDGGRSSFPQALHTTAFFDRVCGYHPAGRCFSVAITWMVVAVVTAGLRRHPAVYSQPVLSGGLGRCGSTNM